MVFGVKSVAMGDQWLGSGVREGGSALWGHKMNVLRGSETTPNFSTLPPWPEKRDFRAIFHKFGFQS